MTTRRVIHGIAMAILICMVMLAVNRMSRNNSILYNSNSESSVYTVGGTHTDHDTNTDHGDHTGDGIHTHADHGTHTGNGTHMHHDTIVSSKSDITAAGCSKVQPHVSRERLTLTYLACFPGSGSSWFRHLLQQATGIVIRDMEVKWL